MRYLMIYFILINVISFIIYGVDKRKAIRNKYRISEATLIGLAVIGGFAGAFIGMQVFRHKTKHLKFVIGIPVISILWIAVIVYGAVNGYWN